MNNKFFLKNRSFLILPIVYVFIVNLFFTQHSLAQDCSKIKKYSVLKDFIDKGEFTKAIENIKQTKCKVDDDIIKLAINGHFKDFNVSNPQEMQAAEEINKPRVNFIADLIETCDANPNARTEDYTPAIFALMFNNPQAATRIIKHKDFDHSLQYKNGSTAAMFAAQSGHLDILKFISTLPKFDINLQTKDGNTAAILAADKGHLDILKFISTLPT
ncbi:MAG: ankyrin repeat domain-containing protein [Oligoflexia bacterium]|nr:ankyrin repeat domain-containing protein [Oligoflexia bacterium]